MQPLFKYLVKRTVIFSLFLLSIMFLSPISTDSSQLSDEITVSDNEIITVSKKNVPRVSTSYEEYLSDSEEILEMQANACMDRYNIQPFSEDEMYEEYIYPLAKIIFAEGGNQDDTFQQWVGYAVINRVDSVYYPDTILDVFFSSGYAESSKERFNEEMYTEQSLKNAEVVINQYFYGKFPVSKAMVFQAQFEQGCNIIQMGNTYFGCDPRILDDLKN